MIKVLVSALVSIALAVVVTRASGSAVGGIAAGAIMVAIALSATKNA